MSSKIYALGCLYTIIGGVCYALGGTCGQYLFMHNNMESHYLVPVRTLLSGILMLVFDSLILHHKVFAVLNRSRSFFSILFFGVFATAGSQMGFYCAIQYSNAPVATVLAYMSAVFVLFLEIILHHHRPLLFEVISVLLVIFGTFIICTHGDLSGFVISPEAFLWSMAGAFAYAVYTVQPVRLLQKYSLLSVVGWGLVIAGIFLTVTLQPWQYTRIIYNRDFYLFLSGVILVGTICSFSFFLAGVKIVGGVTASVFSAVDPVVSVLVSVLALNVKLVWQDFLGMIIVILAIFIMSVAKRLRHNSPGRSPW